MSERKALHVVLTTVLGLFITASAQADNAAPDVAAPAYTLQSLKELDGKPPAHRTMNIQTWKTAEGTKVLFVEARELPMFDMRLIFAAGSSHDQGIPGIAVLTNAMLNEGVAGKNVSAIAEGFDSLGADFGNGAYRDMAVASLRSLSAVDKREPALKLFADVVGKPTFPKESLARIKNQLLAGFEYQKQNPGRLAGNELFERLYADHPYAHPSEGTAKSVTPITVAQLKAFHAKAYAAGNVVIALVGDLSRTEAEAIAAQVSAALPKGPALPKITEPVAPKAGETHIEFASKQTHLMLAQLGIDRNDPDYVALTLGNSILGGGGFGSRLMTEVREKRGLTYGVSSGFTPMEVQGPFLIALQTRAELSENTLKLVQGIVRDFLVTGPTQKELDDAKRELAGSFPLSTASNADIVGQLGAIGFYDLPLTFLEDFMQQAQSTTVEQVKTAMNKHLSADKMVIVTAGPTVVQKDLPPPTDNPVEQPLGVPEH
ncbi:pitrilysin family protein [Pseudomonas sp. CCI3.2]|uniref:M16 family metallopeptidase n=1 Tax=unclassified Pseudomonas TaxID=196821 RepID=UPI002AC97F34|nr:MULTISPECIES: pitrilysin family protein [unclassified Pseudomonas]MEB0079254.1 pitrilysin family protein [Pseudomonas sp. MH10out]MEB0092633.1 pitrilysin family protein [Pseudomonas sp. CCI4.2]MEB0102527.1 pitrilysin family protein [Pseudomonas sp. CCI3.2]MEB0119119.1 pitrilysin family protein [Pseudomonas sp. CCI1.2]MEB0130837.1 pitrilysin family protein [Pseudomonas sp. CCI2.4]